MSATEKAVAALVLLHGGEYGYIDQFADLIREMSETRWVIAPPTRGYAVPSGVQSCYPIVSSPSTPQP